ncbi:MAG: hypothetical protein Q9225_004553 [Loekoesia sp. 1 TL-2023]
MARGLFNLERLVTGTGNNGLIAINIILDALKESETQCGVATELKTQLDVARDSYAADKADPERAMCSIFCNVAEFLDPRYALGRQKGMAYAMSEWFTILAAENVIHPEILFKYVLALDKLRADMTDPLHAFLRYVDVHPSNIQDWAAWRVFRPRTLKKMKALSKGCHRKEGPAAGNHLYTGRDLHWKDIKDQWRHDPDSIIVDLGPKRHREYQHYEDDDDYSTFDDIDYDNRVCPCGPMRCNHHSCLPHQPLLGPHPWIPPPYGPQWQHPVLMAPPRLPSPMPMGHGIPAPIATRPQIRRIQTAPRLMQMI